jgi:hypothetical protein
VRKLAESTFHVINKSTNHPESLSQKQISLNYLILVILMPKSHASFMYLRTLFADLSYHSLAQCMNRDETLTALKVAGRVAVRYTKQPIRHQKKYVINPRNVISNSFYQYDTF